MREVTWYIYRDGAQYGPFSDQQFRDLCDNEQVYPDDLIWRSGRESWTRHDHFHARTKTPEIQLALRVLVRNIISRFARFARTVRNILFDPAVLGLQLIDQRPGDTWRAVSFHVNIFVFLFALSNALSSISYFGGLSQWRAVWQHATQVVLGALIFYLLNIACRQRVRVSGTAQSVLYVDGVFLIALSIFNLAIAAVIFGLVGQGGDVDIIETEYQRCLAESSPIYNFLHGKQVFYTHAEYSPLASSLDWVREYSDFILFIPFCYLIAKALNARYGASVPLNVLLALLAYVTVTFGHAQIKSTIGNIAASNSGCIQRIVPEVTRKYGLQVILEQLQARIKPEFDKMGEPSGLVPALRLDGLVPTWVQPVPGTTVLSDERGVRFRELVKSIYCSEWLEFQVIREAGLGLRYEIVANESGGLFHRGQIQRSECSSSDNEN
ncbi:DUF4339 domain-containing protein [Hyphomicrobium sp. CS1GBMeth3]|uniref:DUF4339 domain-containing protein n=1 Tax=Hyphomicrobium sp. CS1GBMeth3 TaxID=1892845 RepID=UPI000931F030|nr:DUF4339 domain-containing protein [Hyphomicrobium sp. CS1GBMeth3]